MARWDNVIIAPQPHVKFTAKDLEELGRPFQYTKNLVVACNLLGIDDTTGKNDAESELAVDDEKVNEEKKGDDSEIGSLRLLQDSESSTSHALAAGLETSAVPTVQVNRAAQANRAAPAIQVSMHLWTQSLSISMMTRTLVRWILSYRESLTSELSGWRV